MAGKGRLQGGCSGGARPGTGPKKRKPGLTRTQKRLAKQAALAHAGDETGEAQHAAPAPATVPAAAAGGKLNTYWTSSRTMQEIPCPHPLIPLPHP